MQFSLFFLYVLPDDMEYPKENIEALGESLAADARCLGYRMTVEQLSARLLPKWEINLCCVKLLRFGSL